MQDFGRARPLPLIRIRMQPSAAIRPSTRAVRACGAAALVLGVMLGACRAEAPPVPPAGFSGQLQAGRQYAAALAARHGLAGVDVSDEEAIAAGYLERLRLGMGSPFRLMELALRDPRLSPAARYPVAWALLDATAGGRAYAVDPRALAHLGAEEAARGPAAGRLHLALIEGAVHAAADPREGELAVREGYRLAAAEHAVRPTAPLTAASAAALARDRALAGRDARRLLDAATAAGGHPFALLPGWRRAFRFEVEAPPGAPRPEAVEEGATRRAAAVAAGLRALPARLARGDTLPAVSPAPAMGRTAARGLARLAAAHPLPPQAPVWVTVQRHGDDLRRAARGDRAREAAVERLVGDAATEEAFAARLAMMDTAGPVRPVAARVALETAVALRAHAQEKAWHPGDPAPSEFDLKTRFGLKAVRFDADVPTAWRPYYRHVLAESLADLETVLPHLDVRGAAVRFGRTGKGELALATHDPYGRAVHLPPESGVGAIAHEVGHDLDWQVARTRYGKRAGYGTEVAMRENRDDPFASAVRRMPPPPEVPLRGGAEAQRRYARRPSEIFARTFDGYVAAMLAARGRSSGYLSSAQDDFLTGHGIALGPGSRGEEADEAFVELLMVASPLPEPARRALILRWGPARVPTASELAGRVLAAGPAGGLAPPRRGPPVGMARVMGQARAVRREVAEVDTLRARVLADWRARACASPLVATGPRGALAVRRMVDAAAEARVRGIVLRHARAFGYAEAPDWLRDAWLAPPPATVETALALDPVDGEPWRHPLLADAADDGPGCASMAGAQ